MFIEYWHILAEAEKEVNTGMRQDSQFNLIEQDVALEFENIIRNKICFSKFKDSIKRL